MKFNRESAEIFIPDGVEAAVALGRTSHLAIGAHPDDLEIMAIEGILHCFGREDAWFTGVVVTDGGSSPRAGIYRDYTDQAMRSVRFAEQKKAAVIGEYAAQVFLDYPSHTVKNAKDATPTLDILGLLQAARPEVVYTHNLADKHDTHVAVAVRVVDAIRQLPVALRPQRLTGCEVWRSLDWMRDEDKVLMDTSAHENIQAALVSLFDSQIASGKRYDLAVLGRRRANATFLAPRYIEAFSSAVIGMDLTPLIRDETMDLAAYVGDYIHRFTKDVEDEIRRFTRK